MWHSTVQRQGSEHVKTVCIIIPENPCWNALQCLYKQSNPKCSRISNHKTPSPPNANCPYPTKPTPHSTAQSSLLPSLLTSLNTTGRCPSPLVTCPSFKVIYKSTTFFKTRFWGLDSFSILSDYSYWPDFYSNSTKDGTCCLRLSVSFGRSKNATENQVVSGSSLSLLSKIIATFVCTAAAIKRRNQYYTIMDRK